MANDGNTLPAQMRNQAGFAYGPSASDNWGSNFLAGRVINPTQTATVSLYSYDGTTCLYDVAVVGTEGQKGVMYRFDLCNLNTLTFNDRDAAAA